MAGPYRSQLNPPASTRAYAWLWLVVALQVAIPASYYLRPSDRDDERFAWRMFSGVRLKRCTVSARQQLNDGSTRALPVRGALHGSWVHALERGRRRVIERFLGSRCGPDVATVTLERRCESVDSAQRLAPEAYEYSCPNQTVRITGAP